MAYLSCPSCGLSVHRRPYDIYNVKCSRCGRSAAVIDRLVPEFACRVARETGDALVELSGELDLLTVTQLHAELENLLRAEVKSIVVDLRKLTFMDSSGIAALVSWTQRSRVESFAFEVMDGASPVARVLDLSGLRDVLAFREPEALRATG